MAKKRGRPSEYDPNICKELSNFFNVEHTRTTTEHFYYKNGDEKEKEVEVANTLPTIAGFCVKAGIHKDTFYEWIKKYPEFSDSYKKARMMQKDMWRDNALRGLYNPAFAIFAGKNMFGWRDSKELTGPNGGPIEVKQITGMQIINDGNST